MPNPSEIERQDGWADDLRSAKPPKTNAFCPACNGNGYIIFRRHRAGGPPAHIKQPCPRGCKEPPR